MVHGAAAGIVSDGRESDDVDAFAFAGKHTQMNKYFYSVATSICTLLACPANAQPITRCESASGSVEYRQGPCEGADKAVREIGPAPRKSVEDRIAAHERLESGKAYLRQREIEAARARIDEQRLSIARERNELLSRQAEESRKRWDEYREDSARREKEFAARYPFYREPSYRPVLPADDSRVQQQPMNPAPQRPSRR